MKRQRDHYYTSTASKTGTHAMNLRSAFNRGGWNDPMQKSFLLASSLTIAWSIPLFAQTVNVDAAKKEARVVVYAAVSPQTMKVINDPFEKKYGIRVDVARFDHWHPGKGA